MQQAALSALDSTRKSARQSTTFQLQTSDRAPASKTCSVRRPECPRPTAASQIRRRVVPSPRGAASPASPSRIRTSACTTWCGMCLSDAWQTVRIGQRIPKTALWPGLEEFPWRDALTPFSNYILRIIALQKNSCHPEEPAFCAPKDLNRNDMRAANVEILRLSSSDSLRMTLTREFAKINESSA